MRTLNSLALAATLSVLVIDSAHADAQLTGAWVGQFKGIQIEIPMRPAPFDYEFGQPAAGKLAGPRFVQATLHVDFDVEKGGLAAGTWRTARFEQRFVCAQVGANTWDCADAGGRTSIELLSATTMRLCYLDDREGAQGAGCASLMKTR